MLSLSRKICIFGNFGGSNIGNEGSLEAMMTFLRRARPDAEIVCICSEPESIKRDYNIAAHHMRVPRVRGASLLGKLRARIADLALAVRTVRGFDALIVPGTGILDDFGEPPQGMPLTLFIACLLARLRGIKVGFVSVGAGPIDHPVSRWLMKRAVAMAYYCSFRDALSRDYMASIGRDTWHDRVYPDIAFKLAAPDPGQAGDGSGLRIGVGVMSYYGWASDPERGAGIYRAYLEKITRFIRWLLAQGYSVRVLTGEASDQRAVDDLMAAIRDDPAPPADRITAEPIRSLHDLMDQIARTDAVVATRFHNVVCALKMGRPTISLGYAKKNDVLLIDMGLEGFYQHVEDFDLDRLIDQFNRLMADREALVKRVREISAAYQHQLEEQDRILAEKLL